MDSDHAELQSLRREVQTLRARVAELQRDAARFSDEPDHDRPERAFSLPEREELLLEAERIAHMGSWAWELETNRVMWSDELYRILGYNPDEDEASTEAFFAAVHPEDRARVEEAAARGVAMGISPQVDYRILRRDGVVRHVTMSGSMLFDDEGTLRRIVGVVLDLTDERVAADKLRHANELLEEAQKIAHLGSWSFDAYTAALHWSKEFRRIMGIPPDVVPSEELFLERLHPDDRARMNELHRRCVTELCDGEGEARVIHPDGELRHVRIHGIPQLGPDGRLESICGTILDVSDRVRMQEELAHAQKMDAIGRLAGGIAHDFNNLLTVILGNLELIRADRPEIECDELHDVLHAVESARALTQRLLVFGRKAHLHRQTVAPNELVRSTIGLLQRLVGDQVTLVAELGTGLPAIDVDPVQIERALINLVINARDAMPRGGKVEIRTHRVDEDGQAWVEIAVIDQGAGISDSERPHIFEPFYTTKERGKGTGLGLATVLGTTEQHGGSVTVDRVPGGGTNFCIRLPAKLDASPAAPEASAPMEAVEDGGPRRTILVIEDEAMVSSMVARALRARGHHVLVTDRPAEALRLWEARHAEIDLVICDVVMPEIRGPELVQALAARAGPPKVLFMSGYSEELVADALDHPVLAKPFTVAELCAATDRLVRGR